MLTRQEDLFEWASFGQLAAAKTMGGGAGRVVGSISSFMASLGRPIPCGKSLDMRRTRWWGWAIWRDISFPHQSDFERLAVSDERPGALRFPNEQVVRAHQWPKALTTNVCTASLVQVTAPRDEAEKWRALVNEFDQMTRQS